ncbi:thermonuclease family protein [Methanothermococcus sp. SCGC AD-155-M21]|nr:thermonuclease family protein [Methanothermococcus sp. SCGC AD-155-M21]
MKKNIPIFIPIIIVLSITTGCIDGVYNKDSSGYTNPYDFINSHEHINGKIIKVSDGDTIWIQCKNGSKYKIRLLGVDTPETYKKNNPHEYYTYDNTPITNITYLKVWGHKATEYAKNKLENREVIIVFDKKSPKKDSYGRYLAYVFVNGEDFNEDLIEYGYARVYLSDFELLDRYLEEEKHAKKNKVGLWNIPN